MATRKRWPADWWEGLERKHQVQHIRVASAEAISYRPCTIHPLCKADKRSQQGYPNVCCCMGQLQSCRLDFSEECFQLHQERRPCCGLLDDWQWNVITSSRGAESPLQVVKRLEMFFPSLILSVSWWDRVWQFQTKISMMLHDVYQHKHMLGTFKVKKCKSTTSHKTRVGFTSALGYVPGNYTAPHPAEAGY